MSGDDERVVEADGHELRISRPDKIYFPGLGATKSNLVSYYLEIGPHLLNTAGGRPAMLQRFPDGATGKSFYQKRIPAAAPDWLQSTIVSTPNGTTSNALVVADVAHVIWAVNIGCIGLHLWPYLAADPAHADELRIDLDPTKGIGFDDVRAAALRCRDFLDQLGLRGYPKTSGSNGLHVYLRLEPRWDSIEVRAAAVALARELERRFPDEITANWWKEERGSRVFVDFNQNAPHKTVFGAWFARPRTGGQVSTPLSWEEVETVVPDELTIETVPEHVRRRGDPWADIAAHPQSLEPLLELAARDREVGLRDAPWPPQYPKMPDEPTRVAPSRAKKEQPVEPLDALDQIAFRLERSGADTYKVRAFRHAARAIAAVPRDELESLAAAGRLQSLDGVGKSTAQVIAEALHGDTPAYLAKLDDVQDDLVLEGPAAALLESLRGDCHSHSDWSDGGSPILEMAEAARGLGREYLVLTDHSARLTVAHGLNEERLREQLDVLGDLNERLAPFRILSGMEVDILEDGSLDLDLDLLGELDVVVASVHSKLRMEERQMTARMVAAIESPHTDILGHCTGRIITGRGRPQSVFDAEAVFEACARTGTAVEINSRPERQDPPEDLLRRAVALGCSFAIDTDAHAPGQLEWLARGCRNAAAAAVPPERVVNRGDADELVAWTAEHGRAA